jgi:HTH-type transcriptional regulator / antitoxin HipB
MSDLRRYIANRKKKDYKFAEGYEVGYNDFKIGVLLRQAREASGYTQDEIAHMLKTQKSAISRIENHAEDIRLSTLEKFAASVGRRLEVRLA